MTREEKPFLGRWSRRKHAARRGEPLPEPSPEQAPARSAPREETVSPASPGAENGKPPASVAQTNNTSVALPSVDSLKGLASDYKDFLRPEVDTATRSAALKKLFFDPHFNQMDGLDIYIDDYTKFEPLPSSMLRLLSHARHLKLFDDEEETAAKKSDQEGESAPDTPPPTAENQAAALPDSTPADPHFETAGDQSSVVPESKEPTPKPGDA